MSALSVSGLQALLDGLPPWARDLKLNLSSILEDEALPAPARYGAALACALVAGEPALAAALLEETRARAGEATVEEARAIAPLMSMNNVIYRARHWLGEELLQGVPVRLRMMRLGQPVIPKPDQELIALAVSALNGCERCVGAHAQVLAQAGLDRARVHDALRIAAAVEGLAVALRAHGLAPAAAPVS